MRERLRVTTPSAVPPTLRHVAPHDPVGLSDVAELLGVSKMTASRYAQRDDFPKAAELARGRVWSRVQVERWAKKTLPLHRGGRPPAGTK